MPKITKKHYTFWSHPLTLLCVFIVTVYVAFSSRTLYLKASNIKEELVKTENVRATLQAEYEKALEKKALLDTPDGKELFLREKQNYTKEGEEVYVIVRTESPVVAPVEQKTFWQKMRFWAD